VIHRTFNGHDGGRCAAYSQTWLALSLIRNGNPVRNLDFDNNPMMAEIQPIAGRRTVEALRTAGLGWYGYQERANLNLSDLLAWIALSAPGYYYVTIKYGDGTGHANAYYKGENQILYLEPNIGLIECNHIGYFAQGMMEHYRPLYGRDPQINLFKVYGPLLRQ
jgi:hypothetical protein